MPRQRLQKFLANAGLGSRRGCEEFIRSQRVTVNGEVADLGQSIDPDVDEIRLDGETVSPTRVRTYIALNKPAGFLSSRAGQGGHPTVIDLVNVPDRIYPVGRLDLDSQGLILLTNDGALTHRLTHPSFEHEKEYRVLLDRRPTRAQLTAWRKGVLLADGFMTAAADVRLENEDGAGAWIRVVLKQGHKRQIRETARALGLQVVELFRVRIGPVKLNGLKSGKWRHLRKQEIDALSRFRPENPKA